MAVVDASVLVPAFDADHPDHAAARAGLARHAILAVCPGTLDETTRVLRRIANRAGLDGNRVARQALAALRSMPGFRCACADVEDAATARFAADPRLSFTDAWTIELARQAGDGLLTLDRDHQKAWKRAAPAP